MKATLEQLKKWNEEEEREDTLYQIEKEFYRKNGDRMDGDYYVDGTNDLEEAKKMLEDAAWYAHLEKRHNRWIRSWKVCITEATYIDDDHDIYYTEIESIISQDYEKQFEDDEEDE